MERRGSIDIKTISIQVTTGDPAAGELMKMATTIQAIDPTYLTMICDAFDELESIISDGELGALIVGSGVVDQYPNASRHKRVLAALQTQQAKERSGTPVATFLRRTGFHLKKQRGEKAFKQYQEKMNEVLSYAGYQLDDESNLKEFDGANKPIYARQDAERRAQSLNQAIKARKMHPDVLVACRPEFITDDGYFRSLSEANKLLIEKVKAKAGVGIEGPAVAEHALAFPWNGNPKLAINDFESESDRAEQFSLMCMLKALFLMFQDEQTKAYRKPWHIGLEDALDLFSLISFFHKRIDKAKKMSS